jgi:glycosyltransferase involved in cell wall biosynthesis
MSLSAPEHHVSPRPHGSDGRTARGIRRHRALFVTIVPSPYQRDLFGALAQRDDIDLSVSYMEAESPDSPWPQRPLRPFERIMPGFWLPFGSARGHLNWDLPDVSKQDFVVLSSFTSLTGQYLMRGALRNKPWLFWGERLHATRGMRGVMQRSLAAPIATASAIVGIGRAAEEDYQRRFPAIPHFNIPYHCDLVNFFAAEPHVRSSGPLTFFFCGQMIERKGVDLLLLAFDRLVSEHADVELLLVGREAVLPRFLSSVSPAARARVRYEGFQDPEQLPRYFAKSDVFVIPSRYDGWGVVVNQAMAAGLPVITSSEVGAGLDLVETGRNGICVPASDVDALHRAMQTLAADPELARAWGQAARETARSLTPEAGARKWSQVFATLAC